ncbi:MAG TPA: alkaline phosphatase D family protein [Acidimicrobiales bacterium]|nr:alkaline phosphatase D family protein [Acidimicrobiales bacterium]
MNQGEPERERWVLPEVGRRRFLIGAAAATTVVLVGCGSGDRDGSSGPPDGSTTAPRKAVDPVDAPAGVDGSPFTLGVASGDPTSESVILWTRLALDPTADDGSGGMADDDVAIAWDLAADEDFTEVLASELIAAKAAHGHSVHVDAKGLDPATTYWYRFRVGDQTSPVGQTATLPTGSPEAFGLAVVNCQMYEGGAWGAYRNLLDEDVDLVVHLGDYIYEYPGGEGDGRHSLPNRMLTTLADFRLRYASYKLDPDLQAAHARFPFVATWDDHEVANNYMGDTVPGDATPEQVEERKAAAYQAWWENMPARLDPPDGPDLAVYRDFEVGDLAKLYLLDERQDSAEPPCRDESTSGLDYGNCDEVESEDRTRLGKDQEAWLSDSLTKSTARWNLLGNPVVLAGVDAGKDEPQFYLDTWDGFPGARKRLIAQLAEVDNPVVLTGDYHAGMVLDVHAVPFDQDTPVVAPEFMSPPISSALFDADVTKRTPQIRQQINEYGYLVVAVTPDELTATFRVVDDVADPKTGISSAATWKVAAGNPVAEKS